MKDKINEAKNLITIINNDKSILNELNVSELEYINECISIYENYLTEGEDNG